MPEEEGRGACSAFYGKPIIAMETKHTSNPHTHVLAVLNTPTNTPVQEAKQAPTETKCTWLIHYVCSSTTHLLFRFSLTNSGTLHLTKSAKLFYFTRSYAECLFKKKKTITARRLFLSEVPRRQNTSLVH